MNYTICTAKQGTDGWLKDRAGLATGSKIKAIYTDGKSKGKESTTRINYMYALAEERVNGAPSDQGFVSDAMKWGTEQEPFARMAYEGVSETDIEQVGFIRHNVMMAGCSIDGAYIEGGRIIGITEFKCPMLKTHIGYIKDGVLPDDYKYQVIHNLWVTGADWCDFVSYRPGFKLFILRVFANDLPIAEHEEELKKFLAEVDACENDIRRYAICAE